MKPDPESSERFVLGEARPSWSDIKRLRYLKTLAAKIREEIKSSKQNSDQYVAGEIFLERTLQEIHILENKMTFS